jgi:hypothetical protein
MSNNVDSKAVTVSVKIYGRLLAAYPADFRREYGPAMKQLFRDQCRDAWSQAQGRGLVLLWLRVLPDWAKTSLVERLLNLHRRESLFMKLVRAFRADPRLRAAFIRMFAAVFAIAFVESAIVAYLSPPLYFSTATIEAQQDQPHVAYFSRTIYQGEATYVAHQGPPRVQAQPPDPDPYFAVTQTKIIESYRVLTNVIVNLHLNEKLAQQNKATRWSIDETYEFLRNAITVKQTGTTGLLEISVRNPDANLAATIANATAYSYQQFRLDGWNQTQHRGMEAFRSHEPPILFEASPGSAPNLVIIANPARPNLDSVVPTKLKIFLMLVLGGTLLALLAGGGGAWRAGHSSAR